MRRLNGERECVPRCQIDEDPAREDIASNEAIDMLAFEGHFNERGVKSDIVWQE